MIKLQEVHVAIFNLIIKSRPYYSGMGQALPLHIPNLLCVSPALVDKHVNVRRHSCELGHPRADLLVKAPDSLLEQSTLLGVQTEQDAVVVTDD